MFSINSIDSIKAHTSVCKSFGLLDGVATTQVKLGKLCGRLKPVMLYHIGGSVFVDQDDDDFDKFDWKINDIGKHMDGKLKIKYVPNPYWIALGPKENQEVVVYPQMECAYKQFLFTGIADEMTVWTEFTNRKEFLSPDGCQAVPSSAFAAMCLFLGMRHKICPWSIYEMMCDQWPAEAKRAKFDIKKILNSRFLESVVRQMAHGEVDVIKLWGDKAIENVEKIAAKGEMLTSMMNARCIIPAEME